MIATLSMIRHDYGSVEAYVQQQCRLSADAIEQIRRNLTVDVGEEQQVVDWVSHSKYLV